MNNGGGLGGQEQRSRDIGGKKKCKAMVVVTVIHLYSTARWVNQVQSNTFIPIQWKHIHNHQN